ncbi:MAG TPA: DUF1499 domain-containing protein [Rhizomicrobium sp.]|nr:DUF1499 domain-containing protein [Rhizomicrobium sp.]
MRSQHAAAILSLVTFIIGAAIALTASYGSRFGLWDYALGLKILVPGVVLGIIGVLSGGLWLARALTGNNSAGWRYGAVGLASSLVLTYIPLNHLWLYFTSPPIHDISTDIEYAPPFVALLPLRAGAPNGPEYDGPKKVVYKGRTMNTAYAQKLAYTDIKTAGLLSRTDVIFWRAVERAKSAGWNVVNFDEKTGSIEATNTFFWFGLVSDISIRVKPAGKLGTRLDIRAKSRTGENDMGMNAGLVRSFVKSL